MSQIKAGLDTNFPFYSTPADLHQRVGDYKTCIRDDKRALTPTDNESEQHFVQKKFQGVKTD